jgi:hypothetical protein
LTNRTLKTLNGQLNKNTKFDVFGHLKRNGGSINDFKYFAKYRILF